MAHKKFKVSETQLKLFLHSWGGRGGKRESSELTQNRDKHTCTTHTPTHTYTYTHTGAQAERERGSERQRDRHERQEVST